MIAWILAGAAAAQATPDYVIGPGDVLQVDIVGETFGGAFVVSSAGALSLSYCGLVPVSGKTPYEAEQAVRDCLSDGYLVNPQVTLRVQEYRSQKVEVLGAVEKPGLYYLTSLDSTLRSVIGQAGGVLAEKSVGRVVVSHASGERTVLGVDALMGAGGDLELERGDVVQVDQGEHVWVGGEVARPGSVDFVEGLTLTQALMKAGGPTPLARLRGAYLLREGGRVTVNVPRMLRGKDDDLVLLPGDRLVVPESPL